MVLTPIASTWSTMPSPDMTIRTCASGISGVTGLTARAVIRRADVAEKPVLAGPVGQYSPDRGPHQPVWLIRPAREGFAQHRYPVSFPTPASRDEGWRRPPYLIRAKTGRPQANLNVGA